MIAVTKTSSADKHKMTGANPLSPPRLRHIAKPANTELTTSAIINKAIIDFLLGLFRLLNSLSFIARYFSQKKEIAKKGADCQ